MCLKIRGYFPDSKVKAEETKNGNKNNKKNMEPRKCLVINNLLSNEAFNLSFCKLSEM